MKKRFKVIYSNISSKALNPQNNFNQYGFPFTLNPTIGCLFTCRYCYSPIFVKKIKNGKRKEFFQKVIIKSNLPALLDKELERYASLPQHMKRVQINETSDYYHPSILKKLKDDNMPDLMLQILSTFERHWNNDNKWMLHILTKSPLICQHIDTLERMKEMVQVEMSFCSYDQKIINRFEISTPPFEKRLDAIKELSERGIFVRVMAMPFYGDEKAAQQLKTLTFNSGAKAFKHKTLNYFDWEQLDSLPYDDLIKDRVVRSGNRKDIMLKKVIVKSGENYIISNNIRYPLMPKRKKSFRDKKINWAAMKYFDQRFARKRMHLINCGYSNINNIDWDYIK